MKFCFNGCSLTEGEGFDLADRDKVVYDRILESRFKFTRDNIAVRGSSNYLIFMRSAAAINSGKYNCVVTQWSALNRIWLFPGPECKFSVNFNDLDFSYRNFYMSVSEKKKLRDTLLILNHDYHNILDLIDYCSILTKLASTNNTSLVFVNGLLPWTSDLSKPLDQDLDKSLSSYTKEILDFDNRDDDEIRSFFEILHQKFKDIDPTLWVNLFDSWRNNKIDVNADGMHPGILSNQWLANLIAEHLKTRKII